MACNPTTIQLSSTGTTTISVTLSSDPGDGTSVTLEVDGLGVSEAGVTSSGAVTLSVDAQTAAESLDLAPSRFRDGDALLEAPLLGLLLGLAGDHHPFTGDGRAEALEDQAAAPVAQIDPQCPRIDTYSQGLVLDLQHSTHRTHGYTRARDNLHAAR